MSKEKLRRPRREICVGDLSDQIILQDRSIAAPPADSADFTELFVALDGVWASIQTLQGRIIFDDHTQRDQVATHEVGIRYDSRVGAETWILLEDGRRLDVLSSEDLEERHEWILMQCTDRGPSANVVSEL